MKRTFILLAMAAMIGSCSNNASSSNDAKTDSGAGTGSTTENQSATADISQNPDYQKGLALIGKNDCLTCHKVSETFVGPAYVEVAKKYAGQPGIEDSLANKIIHGGSGNWGQNMMTAHQNLPHDSAVAMVKYILLLKQE